jgi:hypothetical protein
MSPNVAAALAALKRESVRLKREHDGLRPAGLYPEERAALLAGAGEITIGLGDDLKVAAEALTPRAALALEMVTALREDWRLGRCENCGGLVRVRRTRPHVFCSARCNTARWRSKAVKA